MKKTVFTLLALIAFGSLAVAQQHRCGTTEYYEMRFRQDPGLEQRMAQEEVFIQQWIKDHPEPASTQESKMSFPDLPGFQSTGDPVKDCQAYHAAKAAYIASNTVQKPGNNLSEEEMQAARTQHKVTFISVPNQSK